MKRPAVVGFVPEDRHQDALLLCRSIVENVALRGAGVRRRVLNWKALRAHSSWLMRAFDVRAAGPDVSVHTLSGGNQQRLVLARELAAAPDHPAADALVFENPTRGLDLRATADVHSRVRDASDCGAAVVFYSNNLDEILALASRVLVVFDGKVREMPIDRNAIGRAMLGLA